MTRFCENLSKVLSCVAFALLVVSLLAVPSAWADDPMPADCGEGPPCESGYTCVDGICVATWCLDLPNGSCDNENYCVNSGWSCKDSSPPRTKCYCKRP